jgi:hypothetical protein
MLRSTLASEPWIRRPTLGSARCVRMGYATKDLARKLDFAGPDVRPCGMAPSQTGAAALRDRRPQLRLDADDDFFLRADVAGEVAKLNRHDRVADLELGR